MKRLLPILLCVLAKAAFPQVAPISGQVINQYGQPLSGAQVYVCNAATSSGIPCSPLANIYYDYNLTQAAPNPFSTDQNGNFNFYVGALPFPNTYVVNMGNGSGGYYTQLYPGPSALASFNGSLNYIPKVTATNPLAIGNSSVYDTGSQSSPNGFVSTPEPIENFMAYGALCNGSSDDSPAWTAAMSAAASYGGLKIIFPPKTCYFASKITVSEPNISLDCAVGWSSYNGTSPLIPPVCVLSFVAGSAGIVLSATSSNSFEMQNLWIKGASVSPSSGLYGVDITSNRARLMRNLVSGFPDAGIAVDSAPTSANPNFADLEQNYAYQNEGDGFKWISGSLENANDGYIEGNFTGENGGYGYDIGSNSTGGVFIQNQTGGTDTTGSWNVAGSNNTFIGDGGEYNSGYSTFVASGANNHFRGIGIGTTKTDNGTNNSWDWDVCYPVYPNGGDNYPCTQAGQFGLAPLNSNQKYWAIRQGSISNPDLDFYNWTDSTEWMAFEPGTGIVFGQTIPNAPLSTPQILNNIQFPIESSGEKLWEIRSGSVTSPRFDIYDATDTEDWIDFAPDASSMFTYYGFSQTESSSSYSQSGIDALWADSTAHRWMMTNKTVSATSQLVAGLLNTTMTAGDCAKLNDSYGTLADNGSPCPQESATTPTVNTAACIKSVGPPIVVGYCSTALTGTPPVCTCN